MNCVFQCSGKILLRHVLIKRLLDFRRYVNNFPSTSTSSYSFFNSGSVFVAIQRRFVANIFSETTPSGPRVTKPRVLRTPYRSQDERDEPYQSEDTLVENEKPPVQMLVSVVLKSVDSSDRKITMEECTNLRNNVINYQEPDDTWVPRKEQRLLTVDSNVLQEFIVEDRLLCGLSYAKFLFENGLFNPGCVAPVASLIRNYYLRMNGANMDKAKENDGGIIDEIVTPLHKKVSTDFPRALRIPLMAHVMVALACSSRWSETTDWYNSSMSSGNVKILMPIFAPLIIRSFQSGQPSIGCRILKESSEFTTHIDDSVHFAFWNYVNLVDERDSGENALKVLDSFVDTLQQSRAFGLCLPVNAVKRVEEFCSKLNIGPFTVTQTKISGQCCENCGTRLEKFTLSTEEFRNMRADVIEQLTKQWSLHRWSNPKEREQFEEMLNTHGPFDVVVDGLNVVHSDIRQVGRGRIQKLLRVLESLRLNPEVRVRRVLVLLRPYVKLHIFPDLAEDINRLATVFTCAHDTHDDPLFIYAALRSGHNCYFVTNDFLRSENERLPHKTSVIFQKWRRLKQINFTWNRDGMAHAVWPKDHAVWFHRHGRKYHLPLRTDINEVGSRFNWRAHESARKWLCINKKT